LTTYEISSNGVALNLKIYGQEFFNQSKIFLEDVIIIPGNKILLLDFYSGVIEL
jgi:hypothetical protein